MKLAFAQIAGFLQKPDPSVHVILVYGPDAGLVSERGTALAKKIVPDINDPFRTAALTPASIHENPTRLTDEMSTQSFGGGRRLVRVSQATEAMAAALIAMFNNMPACDSVLILEGGDLDKRSKLRSACENAVNAVAIPCYIESGIALQRIVSDALQAEGLRASRDVLMFLCDVLPPDRLAMKSELDKLSLYMKSSSSDSSMSITMDDVTAVVQDAGSAELDDLVFAVGVGDTARAAKLIDRLIAEQTSMVAILRATQKHFLRLQWARHQLEQGLSANEAVKKLQPPIFWKHEDSMIRQVSRWPMLRIDRALHALYDTEAAVKRTGANDSVLCAQLLLGMAS